MTSVANACLVALAVVLVDDVLVGGGDPPQAHDLAHRVDVLGAGLDALEAVGAVEDPLGVLGEVVQALELLVVARVADEAVGLGERGRADEARVDLHRQAVRDAGAALDAGHRLGDVDHRLLCGTMYSRSGTGCLASSHGVTRWIFFQCTASMSTIRSLMHRHVAHRLDLDHAVLGGRPWRRRGGCGRPAPVRR